MDQQPSNPNNDLLAQDPNMMRKDTTAPATPVAPSPKPNVPLKKPIKTKKLGAGFFLGCFGFFAFLFVLFVILSVVAFSLNPKTSFLPGITVSQLKGVIGGLVNISFGLFALILLIVLVVNIFKKLIAKKEEKDRRRKANLSMLLTAAALILEITIWIFVWGTINGVVVDEGGLTGDIIVTDTTGKAIVPTNLTAPITLTFNAQNLSKKLIQGLTIVSYSWDLDGDGKLGDQSGEKVSWEYKDKGKNNNGQFPITLQITAQNSKGELQTQDLKKVVVSIASVKPLIDLTVDHDTGEAPLTVTFDASASTDPDGQDKKALVFAWDFDGSNTFKGGDKPVMTYSFTTVGTFPVQVRATDQNQLYSVVQKDITVTGIRQDIPLPKITAAPLTGPAPLKVSFAGDESTSPNGKITRYEWDFGDGSLIDKSLTTSHTFLAGGDYNVQLKVIDEKGKEATASVTVQVQGKSSAPVAKISTKPAFTESGGQRVLEGGAPLVVEFDGSSSTDRENDIVSYEWDLDGDGTFETKGAKPDPYTYYDQGEKTVTLRVVDSAKNQSEQTMIVRVKYKPLEAVIKADPLSGAVPLTVQFDGSASRYNDGTIEQFQWDFNDGTPPKIYTSRIQYTFDRVGLYKVKLTVTTNDGKTASTVQNISVTEEQLIARFSSSIKKGKAPLSVTFDPSSSTGRIVTYNWDFGDGETSVERKPTHVFTDPGTYVVVLKVKSAENVSDQYSEMITVE